VSDIVYGFLIYRLVGIWATILAISHYLSKQKIGFDSRRFAVEFITNMRIR